MRAALDHIQEHAPGLHSYWFRPEALFRFTAGEYTELYLPHAPVDNRGDHRKFTISSSPTEPLIRITVTSVADSSSTFKKALAVLQPQDSVQFAETMGEFVLPKDASIPLVFVAFGAGITPVMSIVAWLKATGKHRAVQIIHIVDQPSRLLDQTLFTEYAQKYTPITTRAYKTGQELTGDLTGLQLMKLIDNPYRQRYYLSGAEHAVKSMVEQLTASGIDNDDIVTDVFLGIAND